MFFDQKKSEKETPDENWDLHVNKIGLDLQIGQWGLLMSDPKKRT